MYIYKESYYPKAQTWSFKTKKYAEAQEPNPCNSTARNLSECLENPCGFDNLVKELLLKYLFKSFILKRVFVFSYV